jgi:ribonuclease III
VSEASVEHGLEALDRALGLSFRDAELREASLTHRSFAFEHDLTITNERLEFLGDSVLGLVVTDLAYRTYPEMPEGQLAKLRAAIVNMTALEAVFGAVYLDLGLDAARELIERLFAPRMEAYVRGEGDRDYKTILQELASQQLRALPVYHIEERGPDHQKEFTATVVIGGETLGTGVGRSKKEAEQQAAREAHARLARSPGAEGNGDGTT